MNEAIRRLQAVYAKENREVYFRVFETYDLEHDAQASYAQIAHRFGVKETDVTNYLAHARRRFRDLVHEIVRESVQDDSRVHEEKEHVFGKD